MSDVLEDHKGSVSIGGRILINFHYGDDIVDNVEEEFEESDYIVTSIDKTCTR